MGLWDNQVSENGSLDVGKPSPDVGIRKTEYGTPLGLQKNNVEVLSQRNKLPWQQYLSGDTTDLAKDISTRAMDYGSPTGFQSAQRNEILGHGINQNPSIKGPASLGSQSVSAVSQALTNKYGKDVGTHLQAIRAQNEIDANPELKKSQEMQRAAEIYGKDQAVKMQNFKEQYNYVQQVNAIRYQYEMAQDNAKSQLLGTILGTVLQVGGMVAAGA